MPKLYELLLPESITRQKVEDLIEERHKARQSKNWNLADDIRKNLSDLKIILEDGPRGTTWRVDV